MTAKIKTIILSFPHARVESADGKPWVYQIEKVTDSTEFGPGSFLEKKEVDELCAARDWKVTVQQVSKKG